VIHRCADVPEPRERHPNEAARAKARYWADPEKFRAAARALYQKHRERYAAASRERMRRRSA
jgi:hypothetical protein